MKEKVMFRGCAHQGRPRLDNPDEFNRFFQTIEEGELIWLAVYRENQLKSSKTNPQLAYFHGVICKNLSRHLGKFLDETKQMLKSELLDPEVQKTPTGKWIEIYPSLEDISKEEMGEFIDNCIIYAATYCELQILSPEEMKWAPVIHDDS